MSIFFASQYRKVRRADNCFSEMFWYGKKTIVKGVVSYFLVKNFLSRSAENNRKGDLCVSETFWCGKILLISGRISRFSFEIFFHNAKKNLEEPFCARMKFS